MLEKVASMIDPGFIAAVFDIIVGIILVLELYLPFLNIFYYIAILKILISMFPSMGKRNGLEVVLNVNVISDFLIAIALFSMDKGFYWRIFALIGLFKIVKGGYSIVLAILGKD